jgi:GTP-binding protein
VGIIGEPNVGKSTLISAVSSARPKIAPYPFTTLVPHLGVARVKRRSVVLCDVPGLIEGASRGRGLGHQFLRHIERCGVLIHLLDLSRALKPDGSMNPSALIADYSALRRELQAYSPPLAKKKELIVLNKTDLTLKSLEPLLSALKRARIPIVAAISAATKRGTNELMTTLLPLVLKERKQRVSAPPPPRGELPMLRPQDQGAHMRDFTVEQGRGKLIIRGKRLEQFTRMTDFGSPGGLRRFRDVLEKLDLLSTLERAKKRGDAILIGTTRIDPYL